MKSVLGGIGFLFGTIAIALFFHYGTLHPCSAMKKEMRVQLLRNLVEQSPTSSWEQMGAGLGLALGGTMIDTIVDALSPWQCVNGLFRLAQGHDFLSDHLSQAKKRDPSALAPHSPPTAPTWRVREEQSKIDDSMNVYLSKVSNESIKDWLNSEVRPSLWVRCREGNTEVFINFDMQLQTDYSYERGSTAEVTLRYDKTPAKKSRFALSTDQKAIFFREHIPTVKRLLQSQVLVVQFAPFQKGFETITFDLAGLDKEISKVQTACEWK